MNKKEITVAIPLSFAAKSYQIHLPAPWETNNKSRAGIAYPDTYEIPVYRPIEQQIEQPDYIDLVTRNEGSEKVGLHPMPDGPVLVDNDHNQDRVYQYVTEDERKKLYV